MKTTVRTDIHVEVWPKAAGDLGFGTITRVKRTEQEEFAICEEMAASIRRHTDDVASAVVVWSREDVCEHCGGAWTEGDSLHNRGCCLEDIDEQTTQ